MGAQAVQGASVEEDLVGAQAVPEVAEVTASAVAATATGSVKAAAFMAAAPVADARAMTDILQRTRFSKAFVTPLSMRLWWNGMVRA